MSNTVVTNSKTGDDTSNTLFLGELLLGEELLVGLCSGTDLEVTELLFVLLWGQESFTGFCTDCFVDLLEDTFHLVTGDTFLLCDSELDSESFFIFFSKLGHVVTDVDTEDVITDDSEVNFFFLGLWCTWETGWGVWDVDTTITSTLDCSKETGTSGGTVETNIEDSLEWTHCFDGETGIIFWEVFCFTEVEELINCSLVTLEWETELCVDTTCEEETNRIGCWPGLETELQTITAEFVTVCSLDDLITVEVGGDDSSDDITVGETDNKTVLWSIVLVLVLPDKTLTCIVIGLVFATTTWLDLETRVVSLVLDDFDETLKKL